MKSFKESMFEELEQRIEEIKNNQPVLINLPSGLSIYAISIVEYLSSKGVESIIYADETFGGCDLPVYDAKFLGCKSILHFSHTEFIKGTHLEGIRIFYIPVYVEWDVKETAKIIGDNIPKNKVLSLHAHLQYVRGLPQLKKILENQGYRVVLKQSPLQSFPGQILGCEVGASHISYREGAEIAIYIGDGKFHYYALLKEAPLNMDVFVIDPLNKNFMMYDKNKREEIRKRYYVLYAKVKNARKVGLLLTSKIGQHLRFGNFFNRVIDELRKEGKEVYVLVSDKIDPHQLDAFSQGIEAFINFACPRIEDDTEIYTKPIISYTTYKKIEYEIKESNQPSTSYVNQQSTHN